MKQHNTGLVSKSVRRSITAVEAAREVPAQYKRPRSRKAKRQALRQAGEFADWIKAKRAKRASQPLVQPRFSFDPLAMIRATMRSAGLSKRVAAKPYDTTTIATQPRQAGRTKRMRQAQRDGEVIDSL